MAKILLIEDEPSMRLGIAHVLRANGYAVTTATTGSEGIRIQGAETFDVVVTDLRLPGADGIEVLKTTKQTAPETGVIIITAFAEVKTAVEAMKAGAYDYVAKPFDPDELLIVIDRYLKRRHLEAENRRLREEIREAKHFEQIIGGGPAMQAVFEKISAVAKTDSSVMARAGPARSWWRTRSTT
jgi:DNA-binding NtrC family response regulator